EFFLFRPSVAPYLRRSESSKRTSRLLARYLTAAHNRHTIHQHIDDAGRPLHRLLERTSVTNRLRIEDRDVREHAGLDDAAVVQAHALGGQRTEFPNR